MYLCIDLYLCFSMYVFLYVSVLEFEKLVSKQMTYS